MQDKNAAGIHPVTDDSLPTFMQSGRTLWKIIKLRTRVAVGKLLNLAGIPGLIRECNYQAGITEAHVRVQIGDIYTVVTVNGLDIYFSRMSGLIDGVGLSDCKTDSVPRLVPALETAEQLRQRPAHTQTR